jgi:hypothetical protein
VQFQRHRFGQQLLDDHVGNATRLVDQAIGLLGEATDLFGLQLFQTVRCLTFGRFAVFTNPVRRRTTGDGRHRQFAVQPTDDRRAQVEDRRLSDCQFDDLVGRLRRNQDATGGAVARVVVLADLRVFLHHFLLVLGTAPRILAAIGMLVRAFVQCTDERSPRELLCFLLAEAGHRAGLRLLHRGFHLLNVTLDFCEFFLQAGDGLFRLVVAVGEQITNARFDRGLVVAEFFFQLLNGQFHD